VEAPARTEAAPAPQAERARPRAQPEKPAVISPDMAPIVGKWRRSASSLGPSTLELGGEPSALRGAFVFSRAGKVVGEGRIDRGSWDPASREGMVEFAYAEANVRLDLRLMPDGTLSAKCCGGGAVDMGDIQYRRAE
jgi:hypothetical protein